MKKIYGFHFLYGDLFVYGDNIKMCIPYIDNAADSIEDLSVYSKHHDLRIFYKPNKSLLGFFSSFRVTFNTKKYSVYSSWHKLCDFIDSNSPV